MQNDETTEAMDRVILNPLFGGNNWTVSVSGDDIRFTLTEVGLSSARYYGRKAGEISTQIQNTTEFIHLKEEEIDSRHEISTTGDILLPP